MSKSSHRALPGLALLFVAFASGGCGPGKSDGPNNPPPQPGPPSSPQPGPPPPPGDGGTPSERHNIMTRIGKGPQSLSTLIGLELDASPPPWDVLQPQAKEYAQLAASLGKYPPSRGSKESWDAKTKDFADQAAALDAAAQTKDHDGAKEALNDLDASCQACHKAHRGGR